VVPRRATGRGGGVDGSLLFDRTVLQRQIGPFDAALACGEFAHNTSMLSWPIVDGRQDPPSLAESERDVRRYDAAAKYVVARLSPLLTIFLVSSPCLRARVISGLETPSFLRRCSARMPPGWPLRRSTTSSSVFAAACVDRPRASADELTAGGLLATPPPLRCGSPFARRGSAHSSSKGTDRAAARIDSTSDVASSDT
jgi:hypothetical protein